MEDSTGMLFYSVDMEETVNINTPTWQTEKERMNKGEDDSTVRVQCLSVSNEVVTLVNA